MEILEAFDLTGGLRAAAALVDCDHKRWPTMSGCAMPGWRRISGRRGRC